MNLSQLECFLEPHVAEELSVVLEEETVALSWYEKEPEKWVFQAICDPSLSSHLKEKMKTFFAEKGLFHLSLSCEDLPQKDWVEAVYQVSPPLKIGKFYIYGSHVESCDQGSLIPLLIDAATAFGSGQHESTEGCLKALSQLSDHEKYTHPLDMGCGSGILAMAMARLWNVSVLACDNDPEAVRVTNQNAKINTLENHVTACVSEGFEAIKGKKFDLITANILAGPLCQMANEMSQALHSQGFIILAGLLNRQAEDVIDAYRSQGLKLFDQLFIGDWSTLILRKEKNG